MSLKTQYFWKRLLWCQIHLYWREIEERITLICNHSHHQSNICCLEMNVLAYVLEHILVGIARKSVIESPSSFWWSIVCVGNMMTWCFGCWFQYQLVSTCIEQRYFSLTTNYPAVITFPSILVFSWSVYAPDVNMIT